MPEKRSVKSQTPRSRYRVVRWPAPRAGQPVVWIVDSEQWPRACLRAELIERGYDAYGFVTAAAALDSLSLKESPKPAAIILELRGQSFSPELLAAVRNVGAPVVATGGTTDFNDPIIRKELWDAVFKRPVSLGTIANAVEKIVPRKMIAEGEVK